MIDATKDKLLGVTPTQLDGKCLFLTHGHQFRTSRGHKQKLVDYIQGIKALNLGKPIEFRKIDTYLSD